MPNSATLVQALLAAFCAILCALSGMGGGGMMIGARTAAWANVGKAKLQWFDGYALNRSGGIVEDAEWSYSDFIPAETIAGKRVTFNWTGGVFTNYALQMFRANKSFLTISSLNQGNYVKTFDVNVNTAFVRLCVKTIAIGDVYLLNNETGEYLVRYGDFA